MSERDETRTDKIEERECMEGKRDALRMQEEEEHAERDKEYRTVHKKNSDIVPGNVWEYDISDRITRVLGRVSDGVKDDDNTGDEC